MKNFDLQEVRDFITAASPTSKIYLGADSERFRVGGVWYADYTVCVVVHLDSLHGCKVFGYVERERDYDQRKDRPFTRMMAEATKVCELFESLKDVLYDREVAIHLDINPAKEFGSNCAYQAAVGYVKAMCNITPDAKPNAWAASFCADRGKELNFCDYRDKVVPA